MKYTTSLLTTLLLLFWGSLLHAQLTTSGTTVLSLTNGTVVTATGMGLTVEAGTTVNTQGEFFTDGNIANNGTLTTQVNGPSPGQDYGYFATEAGLELNGNLVVTQAPGYTPAEDAVHPFMLGGSRNGIFTSSSLPSTDWTLEYTATEVNLLFDALVGINDDLAGANKQALVYPNPAKDVLYLQSTYRDGQAVEIFDALGRNLVRQFPDREIETNWRIELPLDLPDGTYFLRYGSLRRSFQVHH